MGSVFFQIVLALQVATANVAEPPARILFLGDSLTAGYGIPQDKAFPKLVGNQLIKKGHSIIVAADGVTGSTTASGLSRLKWQLKKPPKILVLALGANDGLRGFKPDVTKANLKKIVDLAKKHKIKVLLAGMRMPPNYGKKYVTAFRKSFTSLAKEEKLTFLPFLLKGVAGVKSLNIADGIHPNIKGHEVIAKTVIEYLEPML